MGLLQLDYMIKRLFNACVHREYKKLQDDHDAEDAINVNNFYKETGSREIFTVSSTYNLYFKKTFV